MINEQEIYSIPEGAPMPSVIDKEIANSLATENPDVIPNDEFAANHLVSYAVNLLCPAQIWQLRNSAAHYQSPADANAYTAPIPTQRRH